MEKNFPDGAVVTANFNNRKSDRPWLIRAKEDKPQNAQAFKAVVATNVEFKPSASDSYERGFGCKVVANCATAEGLAVDPTFEKEKAVRLQFCNYWFENAATGETVETVDTLYLTSDGQMYGVLPTVAADKKVEETAEVAGA